MALPKIDAPTYDLEMISTGEVIKFRPFLVKEQKILLMATEDGTPSGISNGVTQIVSNCTFGKIDATKVPIFEIENLFLRMREKSVGEIAEFNVLCTDEECNGSTKTELDLRELSLDKSLVKDPTIKITDNLYVNMKYPSLDNLTQLQDLNNVEDNFNFLVSCIDTIEYNGEIIDAKTSSREELQEFIESMTQAQFDKIKSFFTDMPRVVGQLNYECVVCGKQNVREISGLQNFLA